MQHEGKTVQPFQYNGQDGVMHDANGLYYMRARYYHTGLKRFLNRDVVKGTVVEGQTLNRYAYVNGDPVSYVDPLGLSRDSKGNGTSEYTYNMVENPGPLAELNTGAASTFRSGMYNIEILETDTIFYRSGKAGGGKNALGQYFTRESTTKIEGRIDLAVKEQWIDPKTGVLTGTSPLDTVYEIKIPKGTTIYEGPAGYQGGIYLGGGNQIFISEPWKINGVEVISAAAIK
ncbi:hypothetical protein D3C77_505580 [compost metagenome]